MSDISFALPESLLLPEPDEPEKWQDRALCKETDPEAFFPEKGGSTKEAKRICNSCDVQAECLKYALENDERFGVWGGLSERERRHMKRQAINTAAASFAAAQETPDWDEHRQLLAEAQERDLAERAAVLQRGAA